MRKLLPRLAKNKGILLGSILVFPILSIMVYSSFPHTSKQAIEKLFPNKKALPIYIIYSPTCPHCENLINTLKEKGINVYLISIYDVNRVNLPIEVRSKLEGVPLVFAKVNGTFLYIVGYPAKVQENNGYFESKKYEENYCKSINGKPYYENRTYKFCWQSNNTILGNEYAIEWLVAQCEKGYCSYINLS